MAHRKPAPTFYCAYCGVEKERRRQMLKNGQSVGFDMKQRFCSPECGYKGRRWRPINEDGHIHSTGYVRLHRRGGEKIYQHRAVMEKILGRKLAADETVHHKDGDRTNNDPLNLELWNSGQPKKGQRVDDKVAWARELLRRYHPNAGLVADEVLIGALSMAA